MQSNLSAAAFETPTKRPLKKHRTIMNRYHNLIATLTPWSEGGRKIRNSSGSTGIAASE